MRFDSLREAPAVARLLSSRGWMGAALALAGLLGSGASAARADEDPGAGDWAAGEAYRALGADPAVPGLWAYAREKLEEAGLETEGAWLFVVRREGEPEMAYRVDADVAQDGGAYLSLEAVGRDES